MSLPDGQWFLIDKDDRQMIWICAVCGGPFNDKCFPFLLGIKTGIDPGDICICEGCRSGLCGRCNP
eukprot:1526031-Karenia_brevis.AAC.1